MTSKQKKERLVPSDRVYYRIEWDKKADPKKTELVYLNLGNLKTIPYHDWIPPDRGGDIPWHRIYKILYGGKILWDRDNRIYNDDVFDEVDNFSNMSIIKYVDKGWKEMTSKSYDTVPDTIKIFTLNCLFDIYDKRVTDLTPRLPLLVKAIEEQNADIVCLQEITIPMKTYILDNDFVKNNYYVSGNEPKQYGQITLSKYRPKSQNLVAFGGNNMKKYLSMTFDTFYDSNIEIYNIHLTSDQQVNSKKKREAQFDQLYNDMSSDKFIVVGDFNSSEKIDKVGVFDAWETLRGDEPGLTFDYVENKLASQTSKTCLQARLDRMIYKNVKPQNIKIVCNDPIDDVWISDHYGLVSTFHIGNDTTDEVDYVDTSKLTIKPGTTLGVILNPDIWEPINRFRKRFDHSFKSWPPHVTVFQRFVVFDNWELIKENLNKLMVNDVTLVFDQVEIFTLTQNFALVITSSNPSKFQDIRASMENVIGINIESTPHITLGTFDSEKQAKSAKTDAQLMLSTEGPFEVNLNTMTLMKKIGDQFQAIDYIGSIPKCDPMELVLNIAKNITKENLNIITVGSRAYGITDSDYDLVISGDYCASDFKKLFTSYAKMTPHFKYAELIESKLPTINLLTSDDVEFNLIYTREIGNKIQNEMILNMIKVPEEVKKLTENNFDEFCVRYKMVRCWAKRRQIYGSSYGYLNGISWMILTLNVFLNNIELKKRQFMKEFFRFYSEYDWTIPININNLPYETDTKIDKMVQLANIVKPATKVVRNISPQTWKIILDEFDRAKSLDNDFDNILKQRTISGCYVKLTISDSTVYTTIQKQRKVTSDIWRLPIRANCINPFTTWKNEDGNLIYMLGVSKASDTDIIYSHFKGFGCLEFGSK